MNRFEDIEKKIQIKLSGQDKRSYLDIAKKQASSALIIDQEEQESNLSQSRCSYLPSYQLQSSLHFSTSISEITKAEKESMNKTIIAHNIGDIKIEQILKRKEEKDDQIKVFYTNNIQTDQDSNSSQKCKKASVLNKQTNSKQFKKSIYYDKQKKMSVLNQKKEPKKKVNYAQRTENIYDKMKPKLTNFINKFTLFGRFKQMTEQSRILLGDLSDKSNYIRNYQKYSTFRQLLEMFLLVLKNMEKLVIIIFEKIPLFNPENKFRILINSLIACYNCFYLFTISLTLFFQAQFGHYGHLFHNVAIAAWIIEMILQMNTATYHDGDFVTDRKTIFRIYVKEYFFFEVLPLIFEGKASSNSAVNILLHLPLLLKLKGMSIILSKLEFLILQHLHKPHLLQICKQMLSILLLVHIMACSYATLAHFEKSVLLIQENWIEIKKMQKPDNFWWQNYIEAQLWAFYTLSNSYSSSVTSQYEQVFTSFWMLLSYVIFAYNLLVLKNILQDMNSASENYKKELTLLNRYMKRKKIDLELQREINSHVVKHFEQEISAQFDAEKQALTKLSPQMRNKLVLESNKHIINQFPFFSNLSKQTTSDLYQIIEEECHAEGQEIQIFEKKTQEYFLYLIISGKGNKCYLKQQLSVNYFFPFHIKVEILQSFEENCQDLVSFNQDSQNTNQDEKNKKSIINQAHQKQICILKDKQTFGEYEFISNTTLPYIARCHQKTLLIKISSLKFQEIIKRNQQDLQKIMELKQRIYLSKQIELLKFQCVICKEKDHHFVNCYLTHFNKSPYYIIKKNNFSKNQERSNAQKRDCKKQQRFILELKTQQAISNYDENTEITSHHQIHSQMEDETSIFNQGNHSSYIQNKFKFSREESQSETSDSQESQTNEDSQNQFKKIHSLKAMRRASVKSNNCSIKHLSKASEMQEQLQFQDKKELIKKSSANIDDRLPPQNTDDKSLSIFLNNSQNNLSEQTPSQTVLYPVILAPSQFNKSVNQIPSNKIIKKQTQFQNQIQLGSIPEIDQFHKQQDQQNKHSEQTQNNIFRRSSLAPTNTVLGKRFSVRNRYSISFQSHAKIENEAFKKVWDGSSLYWAFDKAVNYIYFFPQYNYKNIIRNIYHLKGKKITQKQVKKPII